MNQLLASLREDLPEARVSAFAPGRVNLIGEHTDYNGLPGPLAINFGDAAAAAPRSGHEALGAGRLFAAESTPLPGPAAREQLGRLRGVSREVSPKQIEHLPRLPNS